MFIQIMHSDIVLYVEIIIRCSGGKSGNGVAHGLAQLAITDPNKIWVEKVPAQVHNLYFSELIS